MKVTQLVLWVVVVVVVLSTLLFNIVLHMSSSGKPTGAVGVAVHAHVHVQQIDALPLLEVDPNSYIYQSESVVEDEKEGEEAGEGEGAGGGGGVSSVAIPTINVNTRIMNYSLVSSISSSSSGTGVATFDDSSYQEYVAKAAAVYKSLAGHRYKQKSLNLTLEQYMKALSEQPQCTAKPIFMTMARVSSDLYWQLIENFFHTMYYFGNVVSVVRVQFCFHLKFSYCCDFIFCRIVLLWCACPIRSVCHSVKRVISLVLIMPMRDPMHLLLSK
jgi:hypothetical protein